MQNDHQILERAREKLQKHWGHAAFREGQQQAITAVLQGRDTLVLLPTGGGKSLCYQVPATLFDGTTLVLSPLVSLMQDQVEQLNRAGIRSTFINSTLPLHEVEQRLVNARNGMYKLLYLSPERLHTPIWERMSADLNVSMVAVDEAHCVSQWGHDFRPDYRRIRDSLNGLAGSPGWIALTATATPEVREDIVRNLELNDPVRVAGGFGRPNLQWWVGSAHQKKKKLVAAVSRGVKKGSGIVYGGTRLDCEKIAGLLNRTGIRAKAYHAGMGGEERQAVQRGWLEGVFPVVVATNAFGMGIDKPDCRFVIHYEMPFTLEAYYQEAGRAGRDGREAWPLLLYRETDYHTLKGRLLRSYPSHEDLSRLYDVICDELELATGSAQQESQPVSAAALARRSSCDENAVHAGLKVLGRLEILELTNVSRPRLGIRFTVGREILLDRIDSSPPARSVFLDRLLRLCGPAAFRKVHYLDLDLLMEKLAVNRSGLSKAIRIFADYDRILEDHWLDGDPVIRLTEPRRTRMPAARGEVEGYRDILLKKLDQMNTYAATSTCREKFLRIYFGETGVKDCGHCDRCRRAGENADVPGTDEISVLREALRRPVTLAELTPATGWSREKLKRVLRLLISEDRVKVWEKDSSRYVWKNGRH